MNKLTKIIFILLTILAMSLPAFAENIIDENLKIPITFQNGVFKLETS